VPEERTIAWFVIFNSIEDQCRRVRRMLAIENVNNGAHLEIPVDVFEHGKLAALFDDRQPIAQTFIFHHSSSMASAAAVSTHERSPNQLKRRS